jgi:hypothetical protein
VERQTVVDLNVALAQLAIYVPKVESAGFAGQPIATPSDLS